MVGGLRLKRALLEYDDDFRRPAQVKRLKLRKQRPFRDDVGRECRRAQELSQALHARTDVAGALSAAMARNVGQIRDDDELPLRSTDGHVQDSRALVQNGGALHESPERAAFRVHEIQDDEQSFVPLHSVNSGCRCGGLSAMRR